ncbi:unnamed protein product [Paramecium sonneborni]|uniref:Uncharacterized protein n=1 Tax=Paramecium sonneborni TaxID=65129 RepID=A0A8S1P343_9CILI|nr:unnamed protein product [Paramecium sonneborni]
MSNQQNINLHPLYIEQQEWLAQFKSPLPQTNQFQQQQQSFGTPHFAQLQHMGFCNHKKNYRLLKRYNWNINKVVQSLNEQNDANQQNTNFDNIIQIISNTKILYLDCNNIKYACHQWNKFKGKPKKQIKNVLKIIFVWIQMAEQQLDEVHLIWDVYKMNKIQKIKQKLSQYEPFNFFHELNEQEKITTFKILNKQKFINFSIQSAYPEIADDLIVKLCIGQHNCQTTVVTSDKELRVRLQELGVTQFIGNGRWWKLKEELIQQAQQSQQPQQQQQQQLLQQQQLQQQQQQQQQQKQQTCNNEFQKQ